MDNYLKGGKYGVCKIEEIPGPILREFGAIRAVAHQHKALRDKIDEIIRKRFIEAVTNAGCEWCSRAFFVPNPNGKWGLVIDYRHASTQIGNYRFTLPLIEDQLIEQSQNHLWTIVELEGGFHQMLCRSTAKETTGSNGASCPWVSKLVLRLFNAWWQTVSSEKVIQTPSRRLIFILNGTPAVDGEIWQNSLDLHWERVKRLFQWLHDFYLTPKPDKCHLFLTQVKHCRHILEGGTRRRAQYKVEAITGWTKESIKTPKQMRGFLGLANRYVIYKTFFAEHAAALMEALKGKYSEAQPQAQKGHKRKVQAENNAIQWITEIRPRFEAKKLAVVSDAVVSHLPVTGCAYGMHTDASDVAVGALLEQEICSGCGNS